MLTAEYLINPEIEKANKRKSAIITAIIFILIIVLGFLWVFKNPEPKFPESGILVAMGTTEKGSGDTEPVPQEEPTETQPQPKPQQEAAPEQTEEPVETVEDPNATSIEEQKEKQEEKEPEEPEKEKQEPVKEEEEKKEPEKPNYTYSEEAEETDKEPTETKGKYEMPGNMGDPEGDERSNEMGETPGLGNFDFGGGLSGRGVQSVPTVEKKVRKEQGKIILEIFVDGNGNVTRVGDIERGTEVTDPAMVEEARRLARQVRFDPSSSGDNARGTITITFKY